MADNVELNAGSGGATLATDDIGGIQYQRVKMTYGADGAATDVSDANPMPIDDAGGSLTVDGAVSVDDGGGSLTVDGTVTANAGTGPWPVTDNSGSLTIDPNNAVSTNNSSTTPLGISGVFTGTAEETTAYAQISVQVYADEAGTLTAEFSNDGTNWDSSEDYPVIASHAENIQLMTEGRYYRLIYTNGGTAQTVFRLQSILKTIPQTSEITHLDIPVIAESDALLTRSVLAAEKPDTNYTNIGATTGGNLKISIEEFSNGVDVGNGVVGTETLRVTVAEDTTGVLSVDDNGGSLTVDGTVTANLSATDNAVLDQIEVNTSYGDNTGGGTEAGALRVTLANDSTGVLSVDDNGGSLTVDGTVTADAGTGPWPVTDNGGSLTIDDGGGSITIDGSVTADLGANNDVTVQGENAHDGTTLGNPVLSGARATNSVEGITQVANADLTHVQADLNGVLISRPHTTLEEIISERVSDTTGTSTAFTNFAAGGAGIHNYVTTITVFNSSATDGYVDIRDGAAGSVLFTVPAPAAGGSVINLPVPLKGSANTALAYDVSAALSTVYISMVGFQAQG